LVDKGESSGIKKDMVAIYKFQILGRVTEAFSWYSKILLITDKKSKVAAYTNNTSAPGIVVGQNKTDTYQMVYTSHMHKIEPNDFIISSGQGLIFPEGFCLGKIKKHKVKGLYYKITVEPLIDFNTLQYCLLTNQEKMNAF
jgi:rod shape-determining protein MreC